VIEIFVDADACPVKDEVYSVSARHGLPVVVVANSRIRVPDGIGVEMVVVDQGPDVADDWIAEHVRPGDIVVTADLPLAARCLEVGASAIGNDGRPFHDDMIGGALAMRDLKQELRGMGEFTGGPSGISQQDRSRFLQRLDQLVVANLRRVDGQS
jgi:uncharacterized protein YaiI (UPF0178 family)